MLQIVHTYVVLESAQGRVTSRLSYRWIVGMIGAVATTGICTPVCLCVLIKNLVKFNFYCTFYPVTVPLCLRVQVKQKRHQHTAFHITQHQSLRKQCVHIVIHQNKHN